MTQEQTATTQRLAEIAQGALSCGLGELRKRSILVPVARQGQPCKVVRALSKPRASKLSGQPCGSGGPPPGVSSQSNAQPCLWVARLIASCADLIPKFPITPYKGPQDNQSSPKKTAQHEAHTDSSISRRPEVSYRQRRTNSRLYTMGTT